MACRAPTQAPAAATGAKAAGSLAWVVGWKTSSIGFLKARTTGESPGKSAALNQAPKAGSAAALMPFLGAGLSRPGTSPGKKFSRRNGQKMTLLSYPVGIGSHKVRPNRNLSLSSRAGPCPAPLGAAAETELLMKPVARPNVGHINRGDIHHP